MVAHLSEQPEDRLQVIADFAPVMIWMSRTDKLYDWFNKSWLKFTGRTIEQELGSGWREGVHPGDFERCLDIYTKSFDSRQPFSMDYRLRQYDGEYRWILDHGTPRYSADGSFAGFIGSCTDIHERKELEWKLALADKEKNFLVAASDSDKRLYEVILSSTPDFVYVFDLNHRFTYANDILLKVWGKTFEEAVGKNCLELGYEPWHAEMHDREIEQVKRTKQSIRGEVPFEGAFGRRIYDYIFAPVLGPDGSVEAIAGTTRDVTERYQVEEAIKKNQEALKLADRRKDEFLAMLAHELRNPLAPIKVAAQVMVLGNLNEERVRKSSQVIDRQVRHMVALIDDLLDVSRVTRGLVTLDIAEQDIKTIIATSIEQVRPYIETKQHHITVELDPRPAFIKGDSKRLVQILSNVLNNAAKYTQDGGLIRIEMKVVEDNVVIKITDNGIGISPEDQTIIYDLFAQAKRSSDRSQGGLGIGLALAKTMVSLHNGSIDCYSEGLGFGSQFRITFPLLNNKNASQTLKPEWNLSNNGNGLNILVVDDNVDAAEALVSFLELSGHTVSMENDSLKALERALSDKPDVCILDIGLPNMDGNELAQRIKSNPYMARTKLIAATGYGQESDQQASKQAGFEFHLVKPIDIEQLTEILSGISKT